MWLVSLKVRASLVPPVTLVFFALLEIRVAPFYSEVVNHLVGALRLSTFHSPHDLMFRDYMLRLFTDMVSCYQSLSFLCIKLVGLDVDLNLRALFAA